MATTSIQGLHQSKIRRYWRKNLEVETTPISEILQLEDSAVLRFRRPCAAATRSHSMTFSWRIREHVAAMGSRSRIDRRDDLAGDAAG